MRDQGTLPAAKDIEMTTVSIREGSAKQIKQVKMHENPNWSKIRKSVKTTSVFKAGGKKRSKRLSRVMKARRNSATSKNVDESESESNSNITIHVDEESGAQFSYNEITRETLWLNYEEEHHETN